MKEVREKGWYAQRDREAFNRAPSSFIFLSFSPYLQA